MKTLTQIAIQCGAHVQPCKTTYPRHEEIAFDNERELQAFVDAVNSQNSEQEAVPENVHDWLQMIRLQEVLFDAREAGLEDDIRTLRNQLAEHKSNAEAYEQIVGHKSYREVAEEIELLHNQLAERDALIAKKDDALKNFINNSSVQINQPNECEIAEKALALKPKDI